MENCLIELFKTADFLNKNQKKVCAQIVYFANNKKSLAILIRTRKDFSIIEKCEIQLIDNPCAKIKAIKKLFNAYVGGAINE